MKPSVLSVLFYFVAIASHLNAAPIANADEALSSFKEFVAEMRHDHLPSKTLSLIDYCLKARELSVRIAYPKGGDRIYPYSKDPRLTVFGSFERVESSEGNLWILDFYDGQGFGMRVYLDGPSGRPLQIHTIPTGE